MNVLRRVVLLLSLIFLVSAVPALATLNDADIVSSNNLRAYLLNQDPDPAEPGKNVELRFRFSNFGYNSLDDVSVELLYDHPFTLDPSTPKVVTLGELSARQIEEDAAIVKWKLRVDKDAVEDEHEVYLRIRVGDTMVYTTDEFLIQVETEDAVLAATHVETNPKQVGAGEEVQVKVSLENTADSFIKDITAAVALGGTSFAPLGGSTEKTIKTLAAGEKRTVTFNLAADTEALSKVHSIPLTLTYSDANGNGVVRNISVGVKVYNPPRYILNIEDSEIYKNEQKGNVILSFSNVGTGEMRFVRIKLAESEDYRTLSTAMNYMGNLESDDFQTADFDLFVSSDKEVVPLTLDVSFSDEFNKEHEFTHTLDLHLYSKEDAIKLGFERPQSYNGAFFGFVIGFLLLVFWISMIVDVVKSKHSMGKKIMWGAIVVVTFVIGAVLYYILGRKGG